MKIVSLSEYSFENGTVLQQDELSVLKKFLISQKDINALHYMDFLKASYPNLLVSLQNAEGVDNYRVLCSDTLALWILRSAQLCAKSEEWTKINYEIFFNKDQHATFIFQYVVDYCNETGGPLSNSLKDLLTKLLILIRRYNPTQTLQEWIDITLRIPHERRVQYYLLENLAKEGSTASYILQKGPNLINDIIQLMGINALANPIGKAVSAILKELYVDEDHAEEWVTNYWGVIDQGLKNTELRNRIEQYILPILFKTSKIAFNVFVKNLQHDIDVFISCLNIGQSLAIEEEPFPELVSYETLEKLIVQDEFKIKIFQLLTFSPKGSKPINPKVYEILKRNMDIFFTDCEVETRNKFTSMLKQFIFRVKDSAYAFNRDGTKLKAKKLTTEAKVRFEGVDLAHDFLSWLIEYSKLQIKPGAQYQRINTGFKTLHFLTDTGLDSRIKVKQDIYYPFHIEVFDNSLKRLLFDNILSTYDDLRKSAVSLLVSYKTVLSDDEYSSLVNKAFDMLNDYTLVDSGSKIIECLFKLYQDEELLNRLITKIPLNEDIKTAVYSPVDGYFQAVRLIMEQKNSYSNTKAIIELINRNWNIVRDILSHDSPEGCDQYGVGSAQLVLSYAWRSTKESTVLLQKVLDFVDNDQELLQIGEIVLDQLATVRHRGAFSAVYPTFIKVSTICKEKLPNQNKTWLDFNISLIQTKTQLITRRSGGLPFLITAIVTAERDLLRYAFDKLMKIAQLPIDEKDESEKMDIPQVHAFNCIKNLFIESQLADSVIPLIFEALELALSTFSSRIWSVRNCSIMLFTALQNRLFGRKKMSARVFFSRFPGIDDLLVKILKNSITENKLETLFPVLTILSKLQPNIGYDGLDKFKPLLRVCLSTKYWKIREAAARTVPALIADRANEAKSLLSSCSIADQNQLHGHLLAIIELDVHSSDFAELVYQKADEYLVSNQCSSTKMSYVQILSPLLTKFPNEKIIIQLENLFQKENVDYQIDGSKQLLLKELFKAIKDNQIFLEEALSSPFFEVQVEAIQHCAEKDINHPLLSKIANDDDAWTFVRSKAIPLVDDYSVEKAFDFVENQQDYGEDIKRSSLELLGSIAAESEDSKVYDNWYKLILKNSDDNEPYQIRLSALTSLLRYLKIKSDPNVLGLLYDFLSDDDDEIRELACSYFDEKVVTWSTANQFIQNFGRDSESAHEVFKRALSYKPTFKPVYGNDKVLFNIEKMNFYRNKCELHQQLAQMIQNSKHFITQEEFNQIIHHYIDTKNQLINFISSKGVDGILGWVSEEEVFEDVYSVIYHLKSLDIDTTDLQKIAKEVKLHDYLIELLA
ncbi:hypothetical protein BN7_4969 [Wickerhamomyces ciferrii]|uniref:Uncharacterized protein n=1 Tax=Wickerhamomyces ciferrii (strain ATCC 14091 / BCRC 22168 / CBS 111 / JCM 3599 / NBRC 0793 / NRRL Y-1031 F-60-10) TaxID=1206466 RepID=K0KTN7_WICCF|nr:uncharacterized protein BN7_4969 [Wickerhamomyces ciferrii]CCH45387.1 hypothetical protein BN7_4969 [Wickerhamomyces ciferrii]